MVSDRVAFLRRIALLLGALVLLRAVTGCATVPEVSARGVTATEAVR
jgi:hypothetical protein